jgi:hypothetical protein
LGKKHNGGFDDVQAQHREEKKQGFTQLQASNGETLRVAYVFVLLMMMSHQGGDNGADLA